MFEVEHPVGSLYLSTSNTDDPNTKWSAFGITCAWELVKDVFLLGAGGNYALGGTGGEATHKLTVNEMPSHQHRDIAANGDAYYKIVFGDGNTITTNAGRINLTSGSGSFDLATSTTGNSQPHNNMPPYLVTNIWKRIS